MNQEEIQQRMDEINKLLTRAERVEERLKLIDAILKEREGVNDGR